jgi:hypothetical protein
MTSSKTSVEITNNQITMTKQNKQPISKASLFWNLVLGYWSLFIIFLDKPLHIGRHRGFDLHGYIFHRVDKLDSVRVQQWSGRQ